MNRIEVRFAVFVFAAIILASCVGRVSEWQSEEMLSDGTMVCRSGALYYLDCDGKKPGFHEFRHLPNGALVGQLGALVYLLDSSGVAMSGGYHMRLCPVRTADTGPRLVRLR